MLYAGIDPGLDGGIVTVDADGQLVDRHVMPVGKIKKGKKSTRRIPDLPALARIFSEMKVTMCILEWVSARPGDGNVSMFHFGHGFGALEMGLVSFEVPYRLVRPASWCKVIHKDVTSEKKLTAKEKSLIVFERDYPNLDLRASKRCRIVHSGLLDALLIAEYGRRTFAAEQRCSIVA